jgi:very-short-patch-repair endonuclease
VELDYAYPAEKVALEVDGYGVHLRSARAFAHDRIRQNELEIEGWAVARFASSTIRQQPSLVASQVTRLLTARRLGRSDRRFGAGEGGDVGSEGGG